MSYDPLKPEEGSLLNAAEMREQLQSLYDLITGLPTITSVVVDGTVTGSAGGSAAASAVMVGQELHFTFELPQGTEGQPGMQGPPFASVTIDGVSTLGPNDSATVWSYFDGSTVHLTFGLPRGQDGISGSPGEISAQQLADGLASIPSTNAISTLDTPFSSPLPTVTELESLRAKLNEVILALRR